MWWLAKKVGWKVVSMGVVTLAGIATRRLVEKAATREASPPKLAADRARPNS
jgi:hypothetical protein